MRPVHLIGVPLDLGAGRRGVDMGPSAFRIAGLGEQIAALLQTKLATVWVWLHRGRAKFLERLEALGEEVRRRVLDKSGVRLDWEIRRLGVPA